MPIKIINSPRFEIGGPLNVPRLRDKKGFVRAVDSQEARRDIQNSSVGPRKGCYIFALANSSRLTPWYVGKAGESFSQEVFNDSNCKKYCEALALTRNGVPVVYFVMLPEQTGPVPHEAIDRLESLLVSECGGVNPNIRNRRKAGIHKTIITGVMNSGAGKPGIHATAVRKLLGRK